MVDQFPSYPSDPTDILRDVLSLELLRTDDEKLLSVYLGHTPPQTRGRVFGGQVMAQAILAASNTVVDDRPVHSMHCYFVRPGDAEKPIEFYVDHHRNGRSFSVRHVTARQGEKAILTLTCSFQVLDAGADHYEPMPENVPDPEDLLPVSVLLGQIDHPLAQEMAHHRPFDIRHVTEPIYVRPAEQASNRNMVWMKTFTPVRGSANTMAAALAYGSDYTLLEPALRAHQRFWADTKMSVASLDHAMWFHRTAPVDEWMLYVQESPSAQNARALSIGRFYTQDGELIATVAQEGMIRHQDDLLD